MIGRFFGWLGQTIGNFFQWLGELISRVFGVLVDCFYNFVHWITDAISSIGSEVLELGFSAIPNTPPTRAIEGVSFLRSAWRTFDSFIPLSEGLSLVVMFFTFYVLIKSVALVVRIVLALIP